MGGMSPFAQALGGLGAGVAGFAQGRQLRDQEQIEQQSLQTNKLDDAMKMYGLLAQIGQSAPEALNSPAFAGLAQKALGGLGINGPVDPKMFMTPLSALTNDPQRSAAFYQSEPGSDQRKLMLKSYGGSDEDRDELLNAPKQYSPAEQNAGLQGMYHIDTLIANGAPMTPALMAQYNDFAARAGSPPLVDPNQGPQVSSKTTSVVAKNNATTASTNASTALKQQKFNFNQMMNPAQLKLVNAKTILANAETWAIPQRISIASRNADTAAQRANDESTRTELALTTFHQLGTTPAALAAYNGTMNSIQTQVNQDRVALTSVQNAMNSILKATNGANPTPGSAAAVLLKSYADQATNLQKRYNAGVQTLSQMNSNRDAFTKQVLKLPPSYHNVRPANSGGGGGGGGNSTASIPPKATKPVNGYALTVYKGTTPYYLHTDGKYYDASNKLAPGQ